MPLRAKVDKSKRSKMAVPETNGAKPKTGIKVIVIGAGFGGLTAAIECIRHGHSPVVYESFPSLKILGDIISFGPNAGRIFARWDDGEIVRAMRKISIDLTAYGFNIHKWDTGEIVINQKSPPKNDAAPVFNGHRGELHEIVFNYAKKLGVEIVLDSRVENYWETESAAGITLADGTHVVVGSDGVRSKARTLVLGYEDKPKSSGYAVWRSWFSNKDMLADPETRQFCENGDTFNGWIGRLLQMMCSFDQSTNTART
jgi:2-polyprenyl-6-methoxyphenol hydroxylase-like FAD-dependent oxidoreductase